MSKKADIYGSSLYDLAFEEGITDQIMEDLDAVAQIYRENPEYRKLLSSPALPKEERKALIREAWEGKLAPYSLNFLQLLVDEDLSSEFTDCEASFRTLYNKEKGILEVRAVSAAPISPQQQEKLQAVIREKTGKTISIKFDVDPSLIGGMRLEMDGKSYEGSISFYLEELRTLLKATH